MQASDATVRIARSSAEAASGYATAAFAAYADLAAQTMNFWAQAFDAMVPKPEPEPRSWYRRPADVAAPEPRRSAAPTFPAWPMLPMTMPGFGAFGPGTNPFASTTRSPMDMWQTWFKMWPLQGPPACWPMAFAMMGAGLSREVAYPTARANVAMMDAMATAAEAVAAPYSSYRSESGYASAQIMIKGTKAAAAVAMPISVALLPPWLQALAGVPARL